MGEKQDRDQVSDQSEQRSTEEAEASGLPVPSPDAGIELNIIRLGEPGFKVLHTRCVDIDEFDTEEVKLFAKSLTKTMYEAKGVGLAAPQVGVAVNVVVIDPWYIEGRDHDPLVMINPELVDHEAKRISSEEACLSCFGVQVSLYRDEEVCVRFRTVGGEERTSTFEGFEATVVQHELDHLKGTLIVDYLSRLQQDMYFRKIKKAHRLARKIIKKVKRNEYLSKLPAVRLERARRGKVRQMRGKSTGGEGTHDDRGGTGTPVSDDRIVPKFRSS